MFIRLKQNHLNWFSIQLFPNLFFTFKQTLIIKRVFHLKYCLNHIKKFFKLTIVQTHIVTKLLVIYFALILKSFKRGELNIQSKFGLRATTLQFAHSSIKSRWNWGFKIEAIVNPSDKECSYYYQFLEINRACNQKTPTHRINYQIQNKTF